MWFRTNIGTQLWGQQRQLCSSQVKRRFVKTFTAYAKEDAWTHAEIPTPRRLPVIGTTLDIIAAGSAKK